MQTLNARKPFRTSRAYGPLISWQPVYAILAVGSVGAVGAVRTVKAWGAGEALRAGSSLGTLVSINAVDAVDAVDTCYTWETRCAWSAVDAVYDGPADASIASYALFTRDTIVTRQAWPTVCTRRADVAVYTWGADVALLSLNTQDAPFTHRTVDAVDACSPFRAWIASHANITLLAVSTGRACWTVVAVEPVSAVSSVDARSACRPFWALASLCTCESRLPVNAVHARSAVWTRSSNVTFVAHVASRAAVAGATFWSGGTVEPVQPVQPVGAVGANRARNTLNAVRSNDPVGAGNAFETFVALDARQARRTWGAVIDRSGEAGRSLKAFCPWTAREAYHTFVASTACRTLFGRVCAWQANVARFTLEAVGTVEPVWTVVADGALGTKLAFVSHQPIFAVCTVDAVDTWHTRVTLNTLRACIRSGVETWVAIVALVAHTAACAWVADVTFLSVVAVGPVNAVDAGSTDGAWRTDDALRTRRSWLADVAVCTWSAINALRSKEGGKGERVLVGAALQYPTSMRLGGSQGVDTQRTASNRTCSVCIRVRVQQKSPLFFPFLFFKTYPADPTNPFSP